jgi:hypothetical protein
MLILKLIRTKKPDYNCTSISVLIVFLGVNQSVSILNFFFPNQTVLMFAIFERKKKQAIFLVACDLSMNEL